ncbi:hypothetical protein EW026_g823 [Hermanssonia centrifuga]|uniref:Vps72/YL1 C-terminal domain-containing protein n=1 Tax=Hermanssonia centrifuga TaxID=98765 RepID=A0A4V6S123_9APHY|nr:hypothetical protein EW026_g823 [Hermanssonia centrifuga]
MFVAGVIWNLRPPKGSGKKKFLTTPADSEPSTPAVPNLNYTKNVNRRTKNLKAVLTQERERERLERERRRLEREEKMDVDGEHADSTPEEDLPTYSSIEAPPSVLPLRKYCDITGLEGPYTDPATGLRYHDKSIYELIKGLSASAAKDYLSARGVNPIVK